MKRARHMMWLVTATLVISTSAPVIGQFKLGDGSGLDNSLQRGGGRRNSSFAGPNYMQRNALITGNISGFHFFRDEVGYSAPGEFTSGLDGDSEGTTDDLFRFRAQSMSSGFMSGRSQPFGRQLDYGYLRDARIVYRPNTGPTSADVYQGTAESVLLQQRDPSYRVLGTPFIPRDAIGRPTLSEEQIQGMMSEPSVDITLGETTANAPDVRQEIDPAGQWTPISPPARPYLTTEGPYPTDQIGVMFHQELPPAIEVGRLLQHEHELEVERIEADPSISLDEKIAQLEARMFSPLGEATNEFGDDVYTTLLAQIQEQRRTESDNAEQTERPSAPETDLQISAAPTIETDVDLPSGVDGELDTGALLPGVAGSELADQLRLEALDPPSAEQLNDARDKRIQAIRRFMGLPEPAQEQEQEESDVLSTDDSESKEAEEGDVSNVLSELLEMLDYDLTGLASLASGKSTRIDEFMQKAEAEMANERYFEAEFMYRSALDMAPKHVMGRIGLIHAQLGAGMIRSAAFNLRTMFEHHPEIIAARYGPKVMPSAQRIEWIRARLDKMIKLSTGPEPPLVLAYLGYQTRSEQLVIYGLDLAQSRRPTDPLITLLRRIWIDGAGSSDRKTDQSEQVPQK